MSETDIDRCSVRPKGEKLVSAETEYSATMAETFGRIFGRNKHVKKIVFLVFFSLISYQGVFACVNY